MAKPSFKNRTLYHGDNLAFLRGLNTGTVNLIATDPPFNKSRDFHATPDSLAKGASFTDRWSWDRDVHDDWVDAIKDDWPAAWTAIAGEDMGAFLCWLGVRLMEMHRVLADDGSIYLHIDHTAHAYAKTLMDAIFGRANFRNEIAWCYFGPSNVRKNFPRKHDTILFYTKGREYTFNREDVRIPYKVLVGTPGGIIGDQHSQERVDELREQGKVVEDYWTDIFPVVNQREKTGYPTQKPLALYERIIKASSNPGASCSIRSAAAPPPPWPPSAWGASGSAWTFGKGPMARWSSGYRTTGSCSRTSPARSCWSRRRRSGRTTGRLPRPR